MIMNNVLLPSFVTALTSSECFQGLLVQPDEVSSAYVYDYCLQYVTYPSGTTVCDETAVETVLVAPLVPPFSYNNQCSSVLLGAFVPVYIFAYSIQLIVPPLFVAVYTASHYPSYPLIIREKALHGVFWPDHWKKEIAVTSALFGDNEDVVTLSQDRIRPRALLKANRIVSADIVSHLLVFLTFGLCSPLLAVIIVSAVTLKHYMWIMIIGRFVHSRKIIFGFGFLHIF